MSVANEQRKAEAKKYRIKKKKLKLKLTFNKVRHLFELIATLENE